MRKRIRLTGRRQLKPSAVAVKIHQPREGADKKVVSLTLVDRAAFARMPETARIRLRLFENKSSETLEFGTIGNPKPMADMDIGNAAAFSAPSCQLRVVASDAGDKGRVLGSTDKWTLFAGGAEQGTGSASEGFLLIQPHAIAPRIWKLNLREDEHPILYVDKTIPNTNAWVRNDRVFASCVLPAVVREVFDDILAPSTEPPVEGWMKDWVDWADTLMPGWSPPWGDGRQQKREWIDELVDSFCKEHDMLGRLVRSLDREAAE